MEVTRSNPQPTNAGRTAQTTHWIKKKLNLLIINGFASRGKGDARLNRQPFFVQKHREAAQLNETKKQQIRKKGKRRQQKMRLWEKELNRHQMPFGSSQEIL